LFNRVKAVTQEEINAAIKRHLLPGKLIVVTAGDLK
jgi:predicted Zn-dependent peptidase